MTTFYICRHGQTENNKNDRLSGWIDTPLTPAGVEHAGRAAERFRGIHIDVIASSDLGRAFITAYLISRHLSYPEEVMRLPGLREVNYGDKIANMPVAEAQAKYPDLDTHNPGGETMPQMQARVLKTVNELAKRFEGKTVLIAAHDGTIKAIYAAAVGKDIIEVNKAPEYNHGGAFRFIVQDGQIASFAEM
jgi:broad specificity phosphatase PhoE